jgi:hypothetical protein
MPYRQQQIRERCTSCVEELAEARCLRCGRPLCAAHLHDARSRCLDCEEEYERGNGQALTWVGAGVVIAALVLIALQNLGAIHWLAHRSLPPELVGIGLSLAFGLAPALSLVTRRQRFLARRRPGRSSACSDADRR